MTCDFSKVLSLKKDINIDPTDFVLQPGGSRLITLRFQPPSAAPAALLPIYSGFIYATNNNTGQMVHLSCKYYLFLTDLNNLNRCWHGALKKKSGD